MSCGANRGRAERARQLPGIPDDDALDQLPLVVRPRSERRCLMVLRLILFPFQHDDVTAPEVDVVTRFQPRAIQYGGSPIASRSASTKASVCCPIISLW